MNIGSLAPFFLVSFLNCLTSISLAGDELCNGGAAVLCPGHAPILLDVHERNVLYNLPPHPSENILKISRGVAIEDALQDLLTPLRDAAPALFQCLSSYQRSSAFWRESHFIRNQELHQVKDEITYVLPKGCKLEQAALQLHQNPPLQNFRYIFNEDLWSKMDSFQRAALILHEIVLRNYILNVKWNNDTPTVRYTTALLLSDINEVPDLEERLNKLNFSCTPYLPIKR